MRPTRKVIDITTGEVYNSSAEVAELLEMKRSTLIAKLSGTHNNNTKFRYYTSEKPDKINYYVIPGMEKVNINIENSTKAEKIRALVLGNESVTMDEFISKRRFRYITFARQIFYHLCKQYTKLSLRNIGAYVGNRDHSTVLHGLSEIKDHIEMEKSTKRIIERYEDKLDQILYINIY